ncbi:HTH-type transcriptional regulator CatM [Pandoraea cepalis]|uniref:HTH-type transcriptional regulator CatM n=1 Tax=Pandoraea cepalis TaxID=2508294 RepID=A0A5E4TDT7_9BURK|nr:HTH-type transcriptional regulator CatM [Pandoraea cepalis]
MNFRSLQCFVVLAEELNFSRAAERLHIAQGCFDRSWVADQRDRMMNG